jgi:hypothetical protein
MFASGGIKGHSHCNAERKSQWMNRYLREPALVFKNPVGAAACL